MRRTPRLLLPLCMFVGFAGGACVSTLAGGGRSARGDTPYAAVEQLGRVLVEVENEYVDPVDRAKLVDGAIKGMVAGARSALELHAAGRVLGLPERHRRSVRGHRHRGRDPQRPARRALADRGLAGRAGRDPQRRYHRQRRRARTPAPSRSTSWSSTCAARRLAREGGHPPKRRGRRPHRSISSREVIHVPSVSSKLLVRARRLRPHQAVPGAHARRAARGGGEAPRARGRRASPASSSTCAPIPAGSSTRRPTSPTSSSTAESSTRRATAARSSTR